MISNLFHMQCREDTLLPRNKNYSTPKLSCTTSNTEENLRKYGLYLPSV